MGEAVPPEDRVSIPFGSGAGVSDCMLLMGGNHGRGEI